MEFPRKPTIMFLGQDIHENLIKIIREISTKITQKVFFVENIQKNRTKKIGEKISTKLAPKSNTKTNFWRKFP